jgi:O-antigen/teichoic acid export membrane protein
MSRVPNQLRHRNARKDLLPKFSLTAARRIAPEALLPFIDRIRNSAERYRLARGMFWSTAGAVSSRSLNLVASIVMARVLGVSAFGELGIVQSTTNMFMTFAELGIGLTATKHVAEFRKSDPARAGRIVAMTTVVAAVSGTGVGLIMIATSAWSARLLAAPHLQFLFALSSIALVLIVVREAQHGVLSGLEAFKTRSRIQFLGGIANFLVAIVGVFYFGLIGAVCGLIASEAIVLCLNLRAIRREASSVGISVRWTDARKELGILVSFSLPTLLAGAVYVPSMWLANMIMVNTPGGYAQMGTFNAADRWRSAILFLPSLLGAVTLPILASLRGEAASQKYHRVLGANVKLSFFASCVVAAPIALLAPWIMASYGPGFRDGTWILITLCTTSVVFAPYWIVGQSLVSRGHTWTMFLFNLGWGTTLLTSAWLLRGRQAMGLALAYLLADTVRLTAALIYAQRMRAVEVVRTPESAAAVRRGIPLPAAELSISSARDDS